MRYLSPAIFVFVYLALFCCQEKNKPSTVGVPIGNRIIDGANVLTDLQKQQLFCIIDSLEKEIGSQVVIMTVRSLNGQSIEQFSIKAVEDLGIGRQKEKDGLLITVAMTERKTRIEVGYGLEKIITDGIAARIISDDMVPECRKENFYEGLRAATIHIKNLIVKNRQLVGAPPYP